MSPLLEYGRAQIEAVKAATLTPPTAQKKKLQKMRLLAVSIESDLPFDEEDMQEFVPHSLAYQNYHQSKLQSAGKSPT